MSKFPSVRYERRTHITWAVFFVFLFAYRTAYSILGEVVVMSLTPISDTRNYQTGFLEQATFWDTFGLQNLFFSSGTILSTALTAALGGFFNTLFFGSPILVNIAFQSIAFIGIAYLIHSIRGTARIYVAALVLLPSFSLWSSIASKEAIVVGMLSIASAYVVKNYYGVSKLRIIHIISFVVLYIFKAQYLIPLLYFLTITVLGKRIKQHATIALVGGLLSFLALYYVREDINQLAEVVQWSILSGPMGGSTRQELFFINEYDVFWKAPWGMFLAFYGPTFAEIGRSPLTVVSFVESAVLLGAICFLLIKKIKELPVYNAIVGFFVMFWIVFVNYPFGVMNPGSAVRYRSGWVILVIVVFAMFMSREVYVNWRLRRTPEKSG